jgi:hypothetical protein
MSRFDLRDLFRGRTPQQRVDALHLRPDLARATLALVADERVDEQVLRLERLLEPDESVVMLVEGRHQRQLGLLMLSTRRVLFRPHGEGLPVVPVLPLSELSEPESQTGSMTGRLVLRSSDVVLEVDKMLGNLADQFAAAVCIQQRAEQLHAAGVPPRDPLEELVELRSQYAAGVLSTADYEAAKARLVQEI